jgi:hypothetical protein
VDKDVAGDGNSSDIYPPFPGMYTASRLGISIMIIPPTARLVIAPALSKPKGSLRVGDSYGYDQLNRILAMRQDAIAGGATGWDNDDIIIDNNHLIEQKLAYEEILN